MPRRILMFVVLLGLSGFLAAQHSAAAPAPRGPSAEQEEIVLAIDEVQLSLTDFVASLITTDRDRVVDAKKYCEGLEKRSKSLNALVKVIARNNAQAKGDEDLQKVLTSSLAKAQRTLSNAETSLKIAGGTNDWAEKVQVAGREILDARSFDELNKHRRKPRPEIVEKREE